MRVLLSMLIGGAVVISATAARAQEIDWQRVDAALGRTASVSGDVHRYGFPRSDYRDCAMRCEPIHNLSLMLHL